MKNNDINPIGRQVTDYQVLGQEWDGGSRWIGADMELDIPPLGRFFLNVVTKNQFLNERLEEALQGVARPERFLREPTALETKSPYVLNDSELTHDILDKKFRGRIVEADLAESLWYDEED